MNIEAEKFKQENFQYYNVLFEVIGDYYKKFDEFNVTNKVHFLWLHSLDVAGIKDPQTVDLKSALDNLNFKRFVLELNDFGLDDYLRDNLPDKMFQKWSETECACD